MTKTIRETLMKRYKAWEYVAFFGGLALFIYAVTEIIRETYTDIKTPILIIGLGIILMGFPKIVEQIIKRRTGTFNNPQNTKAKDGSNKTD